MQIEKTSGLSCFRMEKRRGLNEGVLRGRKEGRKLSKKGQQALNPLKRKVLKRKF